MKKYLLLLIIILFLPVMVNATSGVLKSYSIKKCPDGNYYGQHGSDNHWHLASNQNGNYYADGEELSDDPCKKVKLVFNPNGGTISKNYIYIYIYI